MQFTPNMSEYVLGSPSKGITGSHARFDGHLRSTTSIRTVGSADMQALGAAKNQHLIIIVLPVTGSIYWCLD